MAIVGVEIRVFAYDLGLFCLYLGGIMVLIVVYLRGIKGICPDGFSRGEI